MMIEAARPEAPLPGDLNETDEYGDDAFEADADEESTPQEEAGSESVTESNPKESSNLESKVTNACTAIIDFFKKKGLSRAATELRESFTLPIDAEAMLNKAFEYLLRIKSSRSATNSRRMLARLIDDARDTYTVDIFRRLCDPEQKGVFVDARTRDERMQPPFFSVNAVLSIPLDKLSTLNATSGLSIGLPSEHDIPIVVFHPSGVKANNSKRRLEMLGYSNVHAGIIAPINRLRLKRSPTMESPTCTTAGDPKQYLKAGEGAVIQRAARLDRKNESEFLAAAANVEEVERVSAKRKLFLWGVPADQVHEVLAPCSPSTRINLFSRLSTPLNDGTQADRPASMRVVLSSIDPDSSDPTKTTWSIGRRFVYPELRGGSKGVATHKENRGSSNSAKEPFLKRGSGTRIDFNPRRKVHGNQAERDGTKAMIAACGRDDVEAAIKVIRSQAISAKDVAIHECRHTFLHVASVFGSSRVAQALLKFGAVANARARGNYTPAHEASANGHVAVLNVLHKARAHLEARGDGGWTPLHVAAHHGHYDVCSFLIEKGAVELDPKACWGNTPLHEAASRGMIDAAKVLLRFGASKSAHNNDHQTALGLVSSLAPETQMQKQQKRALRRLLI